MNGGVSVSVPDENGVMHEMTLTIGEPIAATDIAKFHGIPESLISNVKGMPDEAAELPNPEPQMGGEGEQVDSSGVIVTVSKEMVDAVNDVIVAMTDEHEATINAAPTDPPSPPNPRRDSMMTADELAEYDSETVRLVSSQESQVCQLEAELADIKSQTKAAKKAVEDAKEELRELIQNRDRQRGRKPAPSLFDHSPAHTTNRVDEDNAIDQVNDQAAATREPEPVDPHAELWREYPMTFTNWKPFGLTAKDIERLNSGETKDFGTHPIRVLGDITRFITPNEQSPGFTRSLMDFKGFGEKSYDRWLSAESAFWDWWNNKGGKQAFADEQAGKVNAA